MMKGSEETATPGPTQVIFQHLQGVPPVVKIGQPVSGNPFIQLFPPSRFQLVWVEDLRDLLPQGDQVPILQIPLIYLGILAAAFTKVNLPSRSRAKTLGGRLYIGLHPLPLPFVLVGCLVAIDRLFHIIGNY